MKVLYLFNIDTIADSLLKRDRDESPKFGTTESGRWMIMQTRLAGG
jgi:hypothetical protein